MLTIRLLGELQVSRGAETLALPPSKKTRALLAYLVVTGRPHRRERLCELLWDVPDDPRGALRWSLSKLRGLLDEPRRVRVVADRETVAFARQDAAVDLLALRELVGRGAGAAPLPSLVEAARTVRGLLLEGIDLPGSFAFQAWLAAEREEARRQAAALLRALVSRLADDPDEALAHARRLVDLEPHDEEARASLVRLLLALDRRDEARQHHDAGLRLLADAGAPAAGVLAAVWREARSRGRPAAAPPAGEAGPDPTARVAAPKPEPAAALAAERKQVTVLVASLVLPAEDGADPELLMERLDPPLDAILQAARSGGGTVSHAHGGGLTAVFGAPLAQEDDAVRACRAALDMRRRVSPPRAGAPAALRIALHAGEVVVRPSRDDPSAGVEAIGPVVSLAERMAAAAPPGCILLSEAARRRAEGYVRVRPLSAGRVQGLSGALHDLEGLAEARSRWEVRAARGLSPFVGRRVEVGHLRRAASLAETGRGQIVGIVGEPGIGKSRLLHEFLRAELPSSWTVRATGAAAGGARGAYAPVVRLLRSWIGAADQETPQQLEGKADAALDPLVGRAPQQKAALLALLDVPVAEDTAGWETLTPVQRRRATLEAVKALCVRESQRRPLVLVVEDLHWLDEQTQAALDLLADGIAAARVLLVLTYRPEYRHGWMGKTCFSQVRLDPLGPGETDELLAALLGRRPGLEFVRRTVAERAEGTPLFVEEAVRALVEAGALAGAAGDYAPLRVVDDLELPATLQAVLAARVDRLPPSGKRLLQVASVIGRDVPFALLRRVAGLPQDELEATLAELQVAELLLETSLAPDRAYSFKHALTHEVAYGSVLRERRRALHAELARALEDLHPEPTAEQIDRLAHHAAAGELWEQAVRYLLPAAARAAQRSAHRRAAQLLRLGLHALGHLPATVERARRELDYQTMLAVTMMATKGWAASEVADAYRRAHELCEELGDRHELFTVLRGQGQFHMIRGELAVARALGERCAALTEAGGDVGQRIETHHLFWSNSFFMGDYASVERHAGQGIALYARESQHALTYVYSGHDPGVCCRCFSALVLWQRGLVDEATARGHEALRLAEQVAHPLTLALAYWSLSYLHMFRREPGQARRWAEREIAVCEHYGLPLLLSQGLFQLGWALAEEGQTEPGVAKMHEGLAAIRATGAEMGLPYFMALLGEASGRAGQIDEGLAQIDDALVAADRHGAEFQLPEMLRLRGELMLARPGGDVVAAETCFRSAVAAARRQGARLPELRATTSLARSLRRRGQAAAGRLLLKPLLAGFTSGFETADLREAEACLA